MRLEMSHDEIPESLMIGQMTDDAPRGSYYLRVEEPRYDQGKDE
jgi:hypothetical protein